MHLIGKPAAPLNLCMDLVLMKPYGFDGAGPGVTAPPWKPVAVVYLNQGVQPGPAPPCLSVFLQRFLLQVPAWIRTGFSERAQ
ncbi:hypothetical protein JW948_00885 [bacterium]|nr:hypothetical protein [bacterium]